MQTPNSTPAETIYVEKSKVTNTASKLKKQSYKNGESMPLHRIEEFTLNFLSVMKDRFGDLSFSRSGF